MARRVLFRRDYRRFFGGHLKLWDYFNHVRSAPGFEPRIYFTPDSVWDETNPWRGERERVLPEWRPEADDLLFLEGDDWLALDEGRRRSPPAPVIDLIQRAPRNPASDPRLAFLSYPATRICVSEPLARTIRETGRVNGPIHVIPNGIDLAALPAPTLPAARDIDLLVLGVKRWLLPRKLALTLRWRLGGWRPYPGRIVVLLEKRPRAEFLALLARARVVLCIPQRVEGFYLPALEAMALGTLVVCPDVVGNRGFCLPDETCLRPAYDEGEIVAATRRALALPERERQRILDCAREVAAGYTLERERAAFHSLLATLQPGSGH